MTAAARRPLLVSVVAAGLGLGLLSTAGVFAAATDRATTGQNRIATGDVAELDLQIAEGGFLPASCGAFTEDLATPLLRTPDDGTFDVGEVFDVGVCLRNVGSRTGFVNMTAIDIDDRELACSPGEATVDNTCGSGGQGERAQHIVVATHDCSGGARSSTRLSTLPTTAESLVSLAPGQVERVCFKVSLDGALPPAAQSDQATWRFAFDLLDCTQLDVEPNGSALVALPLPLGETVTGALCKDDVDMYKISSPAGGLRATVTFEHDQGDIDVVLLSSTGAVVDTSDSTGDVEVVDTGGPAATYYLKVLGFHGAANPHYTAVAIQPHE